MAAAEAGHDVKELMERAGRSVAEFVLDEYGDDGAITVVCGSGNNGGDGRIAARALERAGCDVRVVEAKPEDEEKDLGEPSLVVDALFGTGFSGEPRPGAGPLIEQVNRAGRRASPVPRASRPGRRSSPTRGTSPSLRLAPPFRCSRHSCSRPSSGRSRTSGTPSAVPVHWCSGPASVGRMRPRRSSAGYSK